MAEIIELKAGEVTPNGDSFSFIQAIPYSNFRATPVKVNGEDLPSEPMEISLKANEELTGEWENIRMIYGRILLTKSN
jgi:hypothetical protein